MVSCFSKETLSEVRESDLRVLLLLTWLATWLLDHRLLILSVLVRLAHWLLAHRLLVAHWWLLVAHWWLLLIVHWGSQAHGGTA